MEQVTLLEALAYPNRAYAVGCPVTVYATVRCGPCVVQRISKRMIVEEWPVLILSRDNTMYADRSCFQCHRPLEYPEGTPCVK